MCEKTEIKSN